MDRMNCADASLMRGRRRPSLGTTALLLLALASLAGCASTKLERGRAFAPLDDRPKPPMVLVYDFAVSAEDVIVDTFGPSLLTGDGDPSERVDLARETQRAFTAVVVAKLKEKGIKARRGESRTVPPLNALMLKGQFLTIDEGDAMGRTIIGFGRGGKELSVAVQVYQMMMTGPQQLVEGKGTSKGGKRPGMLIPVAGGAALGTAATSAVISGSVNIMSETSGRFNTDIKKLAEELGERAVQFYIDRGWL